MSHCRALSEIDGWISATLPPWVMEIRSFFFPLLSTCVRVLKERCVGSFLDLACACVDASPVSFLFQVPMDDAGMRPEWLRNVGIWGKEAPRGTGGGWLGNEILARPRRQGCMRELLHS